MFLAFGGKSYCSSSVETDSCSLGLPFRTQWLRWVICVFVMCVHNLVLTVDDRMLLLSLSCGLCCISSCPRCLIPTKSSMSGSPRTSRVTLKTSRRSMRVSFTSEKELFLLAAHVLSVMFFLLSTPQTQMFSMSHFVQTFYKSNASADFVSWLIGASNSLCIVMFVF